MDTATIYTALVNAHKALWGRPTHPEHGIYLDALEDATVLLGTEGAADLDVAAMVQADLG